jgi:hypothetical protein
LNPTSLLWMMTKLIANIFCFVAFANKNSGIVYHNLTRSFPFVSFNSSVCFFVIYHYESNTILIIPILGLDDMSVFNEYKTQFDELTAKGFRPKLNITDNQVTHHIKKYLTKNQIASFCTPQSSCECHRASNPNVQSCIHSCFGNYRQQILAPIVG